MLGFKNMVLEEKDQDLQEEKSEEESSEEESKEESEEEEKSESEEESKEEAEEEEESEEESDEEQSKAKEEPTVDAKEAWRLARAAQKGYTLTRQELATIKKNQEELKEILSQKKEEHLDEDEELTIGTLNKILDQRDTRQQKKAEEAENFRKENLSKIDEWLDDLKAEGVITSKKDEDDLLNYATRHKITDLTRAATQWQELKQARLSGDTKKAKKDERQKAGSKIGTSGKNKTNAEQGFNYDDIANKTIDEIAHEE